MNRASRRCVNAVAYGVGDMTHPGVRVDDTTG